jgi:hypothetical protein
MTGSANASRDPYAAAYRFDTEVENFLSTTKACGYGSLRAQDDPGEFVLI